MKYLLYYSDGFIKKFPLQKSVATIGRGEENDLYLDDEYLSRTHLRIRVKENHIVLQDLGSTNGTFVNQVRVERAEIQIDDSFKLGGIEFYLKEGTDKEFKTVKELIPIFRKIEKDNEKRFNGEETRYIQDIYHETLKQFLRSGLKKNSLNELLKELSSFMNNLNLSGCFYLVSRDERDFNVLMAVNDSSESLDRLKQILKRVQKTPLKNPVEIHLPKKKGYCNLYPIDGFAESTLLIYLIHEEKPGRKGKLEPFMRTLAKEISLLMQLVKEGVELSGGNTRDMEEEQKDWDLPVDIVAGSPVMKDLIQQTRKIAQSDLFILIQGESGTGKELFAKLIHHCSPRRGKRFVAINCAAIPDNLLESELFGYERGAFTGAFKNTPGKLELASGGTLVLDEIGNMPLPLQAKLLRALQEYEFYRLGSSTPIKVDLRIISLTNVETERILTEKRIREDLYYRLAHHVVFIPPLRERKQDISPLISHFTQFYSRKAGKKISSFSLSAYEVLEKYHWPGNIRQLENEINRLVNLCDDGDAIREELISSAIRGQVMPGAGVVSSPPGPDNRNEKERILDLLKNCDWNKSRAARQMNMTYQGLHKKMKRLGIKTKRKK